MLSMEIEVLDGNQTRAWRLQKAAGNPATWQQKRLLYFTHVPKGQKLAKECFPCDFAAAPSDAFGIQSVSQSFCFILIINRHNTDLGVRAQR